jgi:hypothetical protein
MLRSVWSSGLSGLFSLSGFFGFSGFSGFFGLTAALLTAHSVFSSFDFRLSPFSFHVSSAPAFGDFGIFDGRIWHARIQAFRDELTSTVATGTPLGICTIERTNPCHSGIPFQGS